MLRSFNAIDLEDQKGTDQRRKTGNYTALAMRNARIEGIETSRSLESRDGEV